MATSSGCCQTGARVSPAITFIIRAAANRPRRFHCLSRRCRTDQQVKLLGMWSRLVGNFHALPAPRSLMAAISDRLARPVNRLTARLARFKLMHGEDRERQLLSGAAVKPVQHERPQSPQFPPFSDRVGRSSTTRSSEMNGCMKLGPPTGRRVSACGSCDRGQFRTSRPARNRELISLRHPLVSAQRFYPSAVVEIRRTFCPDRARVPSVEQGEGTLAKMVVVPAPARDADQAV